MIGGYAQLSYGFNYYGPTGSQRDEVTVVRKRRSEVDVLMRVRAQVAMVMNLDKCIGCHTCSVTCKNVWTNRPGAEYMWFNNVETKPGAATRSAGRTRSVAGRLGARPRGPAAAEGRRAGCKKLANIFSNPDLPRSTTTTSPGPTTTRR